MKKNYYKYLPISRLSYLKDELIRFTQPGDLNDPFECLPKKPTVEEFNNLINSLIRENSNIEIQKEIKAKYDSKYLDELYKTQIEKVNEDIGIFSLSKNWKSSLMWSHYTESHKGFCVGFDSKHNFFKNYLSDDKEMFKTIIEVKYSEKRVEIPMILGQEQDYYEPYITKSIEWKYEEEIRMLTELNSRETFKECNPYNVYLFKVPHSAISEIILGANIKTENENIIRDFGEKNNVKIFKSIISKTTFAMERE